MRILFGVFDWGIGHATRDIPILEELRKKHEVHLISTGNALVLLKDRFGDAFRYFDVPSVHNVYDATGHFVVSFAFSTIKFIRTLKAAERISRTIIKKGNYDVVISDCRYDVFDRVDNSFLINHQLRFNTPFGLERLYEIYLCYKMRRYGTVLVPDYEERSITHKLSRDLRYMSTRKIVYTGILSHVRQREVERGVDYFVSLSGPVEPRRQLLKTISQQAAALNGKVVIAGGMPGGDGDIAGSNITYHSFLDQASQEEMMNRARFLIIRAGFSTIMELAELEKPALLIPSPRQTEQEYLADHLEEKGYFHHADQENLDLKQEIEIAKGFKGYSPPWKTEKSVENIMGVIERGP